MQLPVQSLMADGAAVPSLCAQCVYDGQVCSRPCLTSIRKPLSSSKRKAAEAVSVLRLTLRWSNSCIIPFTGNYQKKTPPILFFFSCSSGNFLQVLPLNCMAEMAAVSTEFVSFCSVL